MKGLFARGKLSLAQGITPNKLFQIAPEINKLSGYTFSKKVVIKININFLEANLF